MGIIEDLGITPPAAEKIWKVWAGYWHHYGGEFDNVWLGYDNLSLNTGVPVDKLKKFMKLARGKGICYHAPTIDGDYLPSGSGNFLYDRYQEKPWKKIEEIINAGE